MVTSMQILQPLLGFDKTSVMHTAQALRTLELSIGPEVCDALGPSLPTTIANFEWLEKSENRLGGLEQTTHDAWRHSGVVEL